jgi:hypothetical protein
MPLIIFCFSEKKKREKKKKKKKLVAYLNVEQDDMIHVLCQGETIYSKSK